LKNTLFILFLLWIVSSAQGQYYLRGEIKDEQNNSLPNVKIWVHSSGYLYYSGTSGGFGIPIPRPSDSLTIVADGYQSFSARLDANKYQYIILKLLFKSPTHQRNRLLSITKNLKPEDSQNWTVGAETYSSLLENEFVPAAKFPETGFTINIDKASYSNVRRFLNMGSTVPPDAVRVEELLNYFNFDYQAPPKDSTFTFNSYLSQCPWNEDNCLLFLHICAKKADLEDIPPANLVFLIDVSGSMDLPNRLPLLKSAFSLLVNNLREKDTVSIVVYGGMVGVWMQPTPGNEKKKILKAIEDLNPGGPTPGEAGIRAAYRLAKSQYIRGGNNRVILATDGDFNVGQNTEEELERLILMHKQWGIYLTCLGVGMGNYKDSKLEVLADRGSGNFAYLDNEREAEKVLMQEFTQTIYSVADNAFLDIRFNPDMVKNYRLIGFDNKLNALADSVGELQGGEVGSGYSMVAMFEIVPSDSTKKNLRSGRDLLANSYLHYKIPNDSVNRISSYYCPASLQDFNSLPKTYRFASSTVIFGDLIKESRYMLHMKWEDAIDLANQNIDPDDLTEKEFVTLIEKAKKIYSKQKKKKKPRN
jgi:Ca-activated chloride channel family protein